jgi:hypothetical protein
MEQENLSFRDPQSKDAGVEGVLQAAETVRSRVPIRSTGADRLVVVMKFL